MNIIKKIELSALALSALTLCASVVAFSASKPEIAVTGTEASTKSITITSEQLAATALSDLEGGQKDGNNAKGDQKFSIDLGGGKCIHGAVIFNDCGHQFIGNTLGEPFGIDNTDQAGKNAYNFNFFFSFDKAIAMTTHLTIETVGSGEVAELSTKFIYSTVGAGKDFLDRFKSGYDYNTIKQLPDNARDYYSTTQGHYAANPRDLTTSPLSVSTDADTKQTDGTYNVAAFQFTYNNDNMIKAGNKISCTLTSLSFTYACN